MWDRTSTSGDPSTAQRVRELKLLNSSLREIVRASDIEETGDRRGWRGRIILGKLQIPPNYENLNSLRSDGVKTCVSLSPRSDRPPAGLQERAELRVAGHVRIHGLVVDVPDRQGILPNLMVREPASSGVV
jgi:hypothetical protein